MVIIVSSMLGKGGMGEVYLAADTRLGREVALKLLPAEFARDAERVKRFEREAKIASALNHPNILTIYEIGREGEALFISTEFIKGMTLRQRLADGAIEPAEAVNIAVQMASALDAAHSAGIVHRDIKPENVMLRPDGIVKVLDFGLAKPVEVAPAPSDYSSMPTRDSYETSPGALIGISDICRLSRRAGRAWTTAATSGAWGRFLRIAGRSAAIRGRDAFGHYRVDPGARTGAARGIGRA